MKPLWTCPACGRSFANANQSHACGRHGLEPHFEGKPADIRALFGAFVARLEAIGPFEMLPQKTRIAFHVRMSFAQLTPRRRWIDGHLVLAAPTPRPFVRRIETISARNHVHFFRLEREADLSPGFLELLRAAYQVGEQRHLRSFGA
ncbi:MAG: hypothetical protein QOI38_1949 [Sphingomonadales bacterium]|jgi:hypothetical protein|nr:hypothetical protein [Sphingomonadales bacterium]